MTILEEVTIALVHALPAVSDAPPAPVRPEPACLSGGESRVRLIVASGLVLLAVGFLGVKLLYPFDFLSHAAPGTFLHWLPPRLKKLTEGFPWASMALFPFGVIVIFMLERMFPAVPAQKTLSTGLVHDAIWELISTVVAIALVRWYGQLLYAIYAKHFSFLTLPLATSLPVAARLVIGAVVIDLVRWYQHWLHHKVHGSGHSMPFIIPRKSSMYSQPFAITSWSSL